MNAFHLRPQEEFDLELFWKSIAGEHLDNKDVAERFIDRIGASLANLADNPYMGPGRPGLGTLIRSFSFGDYLIFYNPTD